MIREVKKQDNEPPKKRRPHLLVRLTAFIVTLALACGAVFWWSTATS